MSEIENLRLQMRETHDHARYANQRGMSQVAVFTKVTNMISKLSQDLGIVNTNNEESKSPLHMRDTLRREVGQRGKQIKYSALY